MKNSNLKFSILFGSIFAFTGALFATIGILLYLFADPSHTTGSFDDPVKNHMFLCGIFTFMGLLFFIFGLSFIIAAIRRNSQNKALLETGRKVYAVITHVLEDEKITINDRHPLYAVCEYDDPYTGEKQFYDTQSFNKDISSAIGATVSVYIDQTNPENYYVDFDPDSIAVKY